MVDTAQIQEAVRRLRRGELVAFPTETVYGLGADASSADAVARIFAAKGRPTTHPVIVHLARVDQVAAWTTGLPDTARRLAERFWPGPLTLVLPRGPKVLDQITGGQDTVAVRIPVHPVARALLEAFGDGIAAPSANRYGRVSPTRAEHVRQELGDAVGLVLDGGDCAVGLESTIVQCSTDRVRLLRPGGITRVEIEALVGPVEASLRGGPRVPGSTRSHYAPATPVELVEAADLDARWRARSTEGPVAVVARRAAPADFAGWWRSMPADAGTYGHDLYATLRALDGSGAARILVERVPDVPAWDAVRDRLERAAAREPAETT